MPYYTGIGARKTPPDILKVMETLAWHLAAKGWTLRSGGAGGADSAFEKGVIRYTQDQDIYPTAKHANIYIPWRSFKDIDPLHKDMYVYSDIVDKHVRMNAEVTASMIHPNWDACSRGAKALHTRNIFQVLGHWQVEKPSRFLVCWAPISGDSITGGTRSAVELAKSKGVEVFNLVREEDYNRISKFCLE